MSLWEWRALVRSSWVSCALNLALCSGDQQPQLSLTWQKCEQNH